METCRLLYWLRHCTLLPAKVMSCALQVHGVDVSDENVLAASAHAAADPLVASRVRCVCIQGQLEETLCCCRQLPRLSP